MNWWIAVEVQAQTLPHSDLNRDLLLAQADGCDLKSDRKLLQLVQPF